MDYERLVARHKDRVYRQMVRVCGNHDDAEDALAEALLSSYRFMDRLRDDGAFQAWLAAIGRRVCRRIKGRQSLAPVVALSDLSGTIPAPQDDALELQQIKESVRAAVEALPVQYAEVYRLRELEGVPAEAVADHLGLSVANVKSRLSRARALVRRHLDESFCGTL